MRYSDGKYIVNQELNCCWCVNESKLHGKRLAISIKIYMHILMEIPPLGIHPVEILAYVQNNIYIKIFTVT